MMPVNSETTQGTDIAGTLSQNTGSQIMRDKIADIITTELMDGGCIETGCSKAIAALPDMVVPLVWEDWSSGHRLNYASVKNGYLVAQMFFPETHFRVTLQGNTIGTEETPEAAKAAAQTHHAAQVLSAFGITLPSTREDT